MLPAAADAGVTSLPDINGAYNGTLSNFTLSGGASNWIASGAVINSVGPTIISAVVFDTICYGDSVLIGSIMNTYCFGDLSRHTYYCEWYCDEGLAHLFLIDRDLLDHY